MSSETAVREEIQRQKEMAAETMGINPITFVTPNGTIVIDSSGTLTENELEFLVNYWGPDIAQDTIDLAISTATAGEEFHLGNYSAADLVTAERKAVKRFFNETPGALDLGRDWTNLEFYIHANTDFRGETEIGDTGLTVENQYTWYFDLENDPEKLRELHETLFANGFYSAGSSSDAIDNAGASMRAFHNAVNELVARGKAPIAYNFMGRDVSEDPLRYGEQFSFEELGTKAFTGGSSKPVWTDDFIHNMGDQAGQRVFGRDLSDQERELTLSLVRGLESDDTYQGPSAADIDAALEKNNPVEAKTMDMSGVLQNFASLVRGR
tara:strand:+ start:668 stop:1639 length:972 start_codon:yes stop_codon:yes gene_type:complete